MSFRYETQRVLIWGKTYPELSWHHTETVCTGGCLEDGTPVRIYPIRHRYLPAHRQYRLYDWIEVPLAPSSRDRRPESRKARDDKIRRLSRAGTEAGWRARREVIFRDSSWHYGCVQELRAAQRATRASLGFVKVGDVFDIQLEERTSAERRKHEDKLGKLRRRPGLFTEHKDLEFFAYRVRMRWRCEACTLPDGHNTLILDWGLGELGRREGPEKMAQKMESLSDLSRHDLRFFMGNLKKHPQSFTVVGVWYPLQRALSQGDLFSP